MAIFAPASTSGYSDPLKALTIKALEKRQADMLAQQAQQQTSVADMATPMLGAGHVLNQVADMMQQRRVDNAVAAQKQELAGLMAKRDAQGNLPPDAIGRVYALAPDIAGQFDTRAFEASQKKGQYAHEDEAARLLAERQASERRLEEAAKAKEAEAAFQRGQSAPQSDVAKVAADVAAGRITKEQGDAAIEKLTGPTASEMNAGNALQNTHLETMSALGDLKEARDLMGPKGEGIRAGAGGGLAQIGAKWGGDYLGATDPEMTKRTERFNQIMNSEAIAAMSARLKGATTDYEMRQFVALMNDPNAEASTKVRAINNMIAKAEAHAALQQEQLKRARLAVPGAPNVGPTNVPTPGSTAAASPAPAGKMSPEDMAATMDNARKAIAAGADKAAVLKKLQAAGVDAGGL